MSSTFSPAEGQSGPQQLSFVQDTGLVRDLSEGRMDTTGAPFDLAIHGKGFFVVQTANGDRYTRNGHFTLDERRPDRDQQRRSGAGRRRTDHDHA